MEARRNARLVAVQAIFQYYFLNQDMTFIIKEFCQHRLTENKKCDKDFFCTIVLGVEEKKEIIKEYIKKSLSEKWMLDRVDLTMQAIISLGIYELICCSFVPKNVIINEYVSISSQFYNDSNIGFVNGILESLAKVIRKENIING